MNKDEQIATLTQALRETQHQLDIERIACEYWMRQAKGEDAQDDAGEADGNGDE